MRSSLKLKESLHARTNDGTLGFSWLCIDGCFWGGGDSRTRTVGQVMVRTRTAWFSVTRNGLSVGDPEEALHRGGISKEDSKSSATISSKKPKGQKLHEDSMSGALTVADEDR